MMSLNIGHGWEAAKLVMLFSRTHFQTMDKKYSAALYDIMTLENLDTSDLIISCDDSSWIFQCNPKHMESLKALLQAIKLAETLEQGAWSMFKKTWSELTETEVMVLRLKHS